MPSFVDITLVVLVSLGVCQIQARPIVVDNSNQGRTTVPQDVNVNAQDFNLAKNNIEEIDNSSFTRYTNMSILNLDRNPLKIIGENTFAQNIYFWKFSCVECNIQRLPENFGCCVPKLRSMHLKKGIDTGVATTIFKYPYFEAFTSLGFLGLAKIPLKNAKIIKLPPSLRYFAMSSCGLTAFPNLTLYPLLVQINIMGNPEIRHIPDDVWGHITYNLKEFYGSNTGLSTAVDFTLKPNLKKIHISHNHLETVPDLLDMPFLTELNIGYNSRMACDRRMCWRRLWDRMRAPLAGSDDVKCRQPSELSGYKLSKVNPKVMGCVEGMARLFMFGTWHY